MCVMLFLIYFAGISISSIDILLEARGEADTNAVNDRTTVGQNLSIVRSWDYGHDQEDNSVAVAFFQDDVGSGTSFVNEESFTGEINNSTFSIENNLSSIYYNYFGPLAGGDLFMDAANLASGKAASDRDSVATLDVSKTDGIITASDRAQLDETVDYLMPGDGLMSRLNANEQRNWRSNQVYMPITGGN